MRQLVFHGFYQTDGAESPARILANPRFDFPPGINYEPWFDRYHRSFAHETGRLSAFLDAARPPCTRWPCSTRWPRCWRTAGIRGRQATGQWCERLFRAGVGYDLVPEEALTTLAGRYRALVLPGARRFSTLTAAAEIAAFARSGGLVHDSSSVPDRGRIAEWAADLVDQDAPVVRPVHADDKMCTWIGRTDDGNWRVALFNDSPDEITIELSMPEGAHVRRWDMALGRIEAPTDSTARISSRHRSRGPTNSSPPSQLISGPGRSIRAR